MVGQLDRRFRFHFCIKKSTARWIVMIVAFLFWGFEVLAPVTAGAETCGFKGYDGVDVIEFGCDPVATPTSPLRIQTASDVRGIELVDPGDFGASRFMISLGGGVVKALKVESSDPLIALKYNLPANNYTVEISFRGARSDLTISWGDGQSSLVASGNGALTVSHIYALGGEYIIKVEGDSLEGFGPIPMDEFSPNPYYTVKYLTEVVYWRIVSGITDFAYAFADAENLVSVPPDLPKNVISTAGMFYNANKFNQPLHNWDVSSVKNMRFMFAFTATYNQPLDNWDVGSVIDMGFMFYFSIYNQSLNNWNVSSVTNMEGLFMGAKKFNQPLNNWDVSNVINMGHMFQAAESFNQPLDNWDVSSVTQMGLMFGGTHSFNQPLNNWDVSSVTGMGYMFQTALKFNQQLNNWDVSSVTSFYGMFQHSEEFNQPLDNWDVSSGPDMIKMFMNAKKFNQNLSGWCVSAIPVEPTYFGDGALAWTMPNSRPIWGTCP